MLQEREVVSHVPFANADALFSLPMSTAIAHESTVERAIQMMRGNFTESLSLRDLADHAYLSPYYFNRIFHRVVGIPPMEYLSALRLEAAKRLLLTTGLSVTDICFSVGYAGLGSFTTRFTQLIGLSPRHLRFQARNIPPASIRKVPGPFALALSQHPHLSGQVVTAQPFEGMIFAGLFPKPIPQGQPVRSTRLTAPGPFQLAHVPPGHYYLLAAAFPHTTPQTYLLPSHTPLVSIQGPLLVQDGIPLEPVQISLRPLRTIDPPILLALSYL